MKRVPNHRYVPAIERALTTTAPFRPYLDRADFLCGVDPLFAGLHSIEIDGDDPRSYRSTAHCVYPVHQMHFPADRRRTTIVLPTPHYPISIVHELGHVLDEALNFDHEATPVTAYAKTDRYEAFAEAFTSWLYWGYGDEPDPATRYLFESCSSS